MMPTKLATIILKPALRINGNAEAPFKLKNLQAALGLLLRK